MFALAGLLGPLTTALGQEAITAEQFLNFFGSSRGIICVGTQDECDAQAKADAKTETFDVHLTFDKNSATLTEAAVTNLLQVAEALRNDKLQDAKFLIEGHTDASGSEVYNASLSERRADAVVSFLVEQGISPDRMVAVGMGESSPRVPDPLDAVNRRVEMRLNLD